MLRYCNLFILLILGYKLNAQSEVLETDIRAKLATVALENRVILSTDGRLSAWANHYELLFDSFTNPFDSNQANELVEKYAAERVFVSADYPQKTAFLAWAARQDLMSFELPNLDKDAVFLLNDPKSSQMIADALRQVADSTKTIWWIMGAGIISGGLFYVLFSKKIASFLKKKEKNKTFL